MALSTPWGRLPEVTVTASGAFAAGSVLWRDARGALICTVVAKATFDLAPGEATPSDVPLPVQEEDVHWDDDASRSVHLPSDLAPFKSAAEVVVVGSAYAPNDRPARSVVARVLVGSVDKAVECFPPRRFRPDGAVDDAAPLVRFSLRWEHAAGGPDNPAGIDMLRADVRGRRPIPPVLPVNFKLGGPGDHVPTVGFGPIAAAWPQRQGSLNPHDRAWLRRPAASPLPQTLSARHFQAAPPDQWMDRPLVANERIVLENLHAEHPRLVMSLGGIEPRALIAGAREQVRLSGDLLVVDTDRALCSLTFRGQVPIDERASHVRIVVVAVPMGADLPEDTARRLLDAAGASGIEVHTPSAPPDVDVTATQMPAAWNRPALPFARGPAVGGAGRSSYADGALPFHQGAAGGAGPRAPADPFRRSASEPPPPAEPRFGAPQPPPEPPASRRTEPPAPAMTQVTPAPVVIPPPSPVMMAPPPAPVMMPPPPVMMAPPVEAPAPPVPPAIVPPLVRAEPLMSLGAPLGPAPTIAAVAPAEPPPAPQPPAPVKAGAFDGAFGKPATKAAAVKPAPAAGKGAGFGGAFGSVKNLSDGAADKERERAPQAPGEAPKPAELRRLRVLDLLFHEPRIAARLRQAKRWASVWPPRDKGRTVASVDEARAEAASAERDRADILRVLSYGRPDAASVARGALDEMLDEVLDLDPPLVLLGGELRPTFDEAETLRTTIAVAQPVAGGDKRLLQSITVAQEALASGVPPRPDAALGLARNIEQNSLALSLPPRYVGTEVDRLLLEGRKYKRRPLLGSPRVRCELVAGSSSSEVLLVYLPESVAASLPLLTAYPVVTLCEARPREDVQEPAEESFFALALGRVLRAREGT